MSTRSKSRTSTASAPEPVLELATAAAWSRWLAAHHASSPGVLLKLPKTKRTITYAEALDGALAWGWIDSQKRPLDKASADPSTAVRPPRRFPELTAVANPAYLGWFTNSGDPEGVRAKLNQESSFDFGALDGAPVDLGPDPAAISAPNAWPAAPHRRRATISRRTISR